MSFYGYKSSVEEGDTVIIYSSVLNMQSVIAQKNNVYQTKYGALQWNEVIGQKYGSKIQCSKGWVYILHPTPELWTTTLPHRTQILYTPDISIITLQLELKLGSVVAEAGTGSGSLSHAIIRTVAPNGHLYTFDFHEERVRRCEEEFKSHKIDQFVTATQRDVVADGFGLEMKVDAVFLDLPLPWKVVDSAKKALKFRGGRFCSFSPCVEQVQKTCLALKDSGFTDINTLEFLSNDMDMRKVTTPIWTPKQTPKTTHEGPNQKKFKSEETGEEQLVIEEEPTSKPPTESLCWNELLKHPKQTTHTGYLTFATLLPLPLRIT
ncbi:tRNA (adenine(58)-N(1))-methyltransferase catalytic subunit trmt61a [Chamberlinius hualienensis]